MARYAGWLKESPHPAVHPLHPVERTHFATVRAFCSGLPVTYRTGITGSRCDVHERTFAAPGINRGSIRKRPCKHKQKMKLKSGSCRKDESQ